MTSDPHHIVIVGGGAGGLQLATKLGDKLGKRGRAAITLIDIAPAHLWKPLLHEVAAGTLNSSEDELNYLSHARNHHFRFRLGTVNGLNRARRELYLAPILDEHGKEIVPQRLLKYDTLVFAVGSITNDFGIPGVREHCMFLDTPEQADRFHRKLLIRYFRLTSRLEASVEDHINIAIAGAGATGVELAAELRRALTIMGTHGLERPPADDEIKFTLIEAADRVLPALPPKISVNVVELLNKIGIEVLLNERIVRADETGFHMDSGKYVRARTKVWAAGIRAPQFLANLDGLEVNNINQLKVRPSLQTTRDDAIFAFGDCASCPRPGTEETVPPRAQAAHQQASLLVESIKRRLAGKPLPEYVYKDYGSLVTLSRFETVGTLMGNLMGKQAGNVMIEGWLARMAYLMLYKMHLWALHGPGWVVLSTIGHWLIRAGKPQLKLH
ncbi:MAG: NAD(P)/FAD-dependent oxidoreductase [Gammaproteobacteria bacterium]